MKESLQRIITWARAHPWLAALIVGVVILLGYIVYKRTRGGGGGEEGFALPEGAEATSGIPDLSGIASPVTGGGLTSIPSSDLGISTEGAQIEALKPIAAAPVFSAQDMTTGFGGGGWAPDYSQAVEGLSSQPVQAGLVGGGATGVMAGRVPQQRPGKRPRTPSSAVTQAKPKPKPKPAGGVTTQTSFGTVTGYAVGVKPKPKPKPITAMVSQTALGTITAQVGVKPKPTVAPRPARTPAEAAGLPVFYTGYSNGVWYVLGYIRPTQITGAVGSFFGNLFGGG